MISDAFQYIFGCKQNKVAQCHAMSELLKQREIIRKYSKPGSIVTADQMAKDFEELGLLLQATSK